MSAASEQLRSTFTSTAGGVMTEEAGAITGELELQTTVEGGRLVIRVRYAGAEEWYTVEGSPVELTGSAEDPTELHRTALERLTRPGRVVCGNEEATSVGGAGS